MATINILTPPLQKKKFFGGILTVFNYANGLFHLGHDVNLIPISKSQLPEWYNYDFKIILLKSSIRFTNSIFSLSKKYRKDIRKIIGSFMLNISPFSTYAFERAGNIEYIRDRLPKADLTISTSYETALINHLYGKGKKYYFAQHFEPLFSSERENEKLASFDALSSYLLPDISIIANSSWLANKIGKLIKKKIPVCLNAIDHEIFYPCPKIKYTQKGKIVIMSYGGRNAKWKGIFDAAEAVRKAKKVLPQIEWHVFGDSLLPPDNPIAPYVHLGYITGNSLRTAYSQSDIMLCTSWYESFPLYPLEAMACGATVISTPYGVEDYLMHLRNGYVVKPQNTEDIFNAIITLSTDDTLRQKLSAQAQIDSKAFNWNQSVKRMSEILQLN